MSILNAKKLVLGSAITIAFVACKKPKSAEVDVVKGSLDGAAGFNESKYTNEQRLFDTTYGENVSSPSSPSIMMMLESSESDARVIDVSLSLNVWGVGSDSKTTTNLRMQYTPGLALHKHSKKGDMAIIDENGELIWSADNPVIAQCSYDAMAMSTATGTGSLAANPKIPFIGAGGGTTVSFEKSVEDMGLVSGSSNYFMVRKGETIADLNKICREIFDVANKEEVDKMVKTLVEKKLIMDERQGFERVMKAAAEGPKDLLKDVNGLEFNIDDVQAKIKNGGKTITGGLKDLGSSIKDKLSLTSLNLTAEPSSSEPKKNLCFEINMNVNNEILSESYNDCAGGSIDAKDEIYRRAIQVAQEIGMTGGQYFFSAKDFPGSRMYLKGDEF